MYLNSIVSIISALDGTPIPPPCPFEEMPFWIQRSKRHLHHVPIVKGEEGWELASDEDGSSADMIATIREMDRRLRAVYWWGLCMGEKPPGNKLSQGNTKVRVDHIERILYVPQHNTGAVAKYFGLGKRIIDNGRYLIENWFDARLLRVHTHSHHVTWWVRTPFAAVVWPTLQEVVELWQAIDSKGHRNPDLAQETRESA